MDLLETDSDNLETYINETKWVIPSKNKMMAKKNRYHHERSNRGEGRNIQIWDITEKIKSKIEQAGI